MWSDLPNQPSQVTYILVFDPLYSRDWSEPLLTLLALMLPLVCRAKESAALVLLLVSACNVVVAVMTGAVGAEERGADELPQATSKVARPNRVARLKACRTRLDFTDDYSVAATQKTTQESRL
jgi:hypothetical protein